MILALFFIACHKDLVILRETISSWLGHVLNETTLQDKSRDSSNRSSDTILSRRRSRWLCCTNWWLKLHSDFPETSRIQASLERGYGLYSCSGKNDDKKVMTAESVFMSSIVLFPTCFLLLRVYWLYYSSLLTKECLMMMGLRCVVSTPCIVITDFEEESWGSFRILARLCILFAGIPEEKLDLPSLISSLEVNLVVPVLGSQEMQHTRRSSSTNFWEMRTNSNNKGMGKGEELLLLSSSFREQQTHF